MLSSLSPPEFSRSCTQLGKPDRQISQFDNQLVVLIADGESSLALPVLRCLSRCSRVAPYVLSNERWAPIRFSTHCRRFIYQPTAKGDRIADIAATAREVNADVILAVDQPMIRSIAACRDQLNDVAFVAPVPSSDAFDIAADKWSLASFLLQNDIRGPQTIKFAPKSGETTIGEQLATISYPVLLKPTQGAYGEGIHIFNCESEVVQFAESYRGLDHLILQSFVPGFDIDCSVLCTDGKILAYTIQKGFLAGQSRFSSSAGIEFLHDDEVLNVCRRLIEVLNWSGIAHIDLRFDESDGKVKVIEINPRFWRTVLGSLDAGVNFPYLACLAGTSTDFALPDYEPIQYVEGRAAARAIGSIVMQKVAMRRATIYSALEHSLRDPIPYLVGNCQGVLRARQSAK